MAKTARSGSSQTLTQRKRMISAINELLKEHDLPSFKVFELKLESRSSRSLTGDCDDLPPCDPKTEKKIQVRRPDGTIECMCVPRKRN